MGIDAWVPINIVVKSHVGTLLPRHKSHILCMILGWSKTVQNRTIWSTQYKSALITECIRLWLLAPPLVFLWLEFPSQLPVSANECSPGVCCVLSGSLWQNFCWGTEEDWSPWGQLQHGPFSSVQPGMGGVGVPWGWGGESSCLSQGGRGPVACLPGQGFQPAVRNQWCQWNLPTPMKSFPVMLNLSRRFLSMAKRAVLSALKLWGD